MKRFIVTLSLLFLCTISIASCATTSKQHHPYPIPESIKSKEALIASVVRILTVAPVSDCNPKDQTDCRQAQAMVMSSGALVETPGGIKGILTVAHAVGAFGPNIETESYAMLINGMHIKLDQYKCDYLLDVCFMYVDDEIFKRDRRLQTLKLSSRAPKWGETIWYTGDPVGIASDFNGTMFPLLKGWFGGTSTFNHPQLGSRKVSMVTNPAAQGASGSVLVNDDNKIVGVVQMVHPRFPFSTLTIEFDDLEEFLNSILLLKE